MTPIVLIIEMREDKINLQNEIGILQNYTRHLKIFTLQMKSILSILATSHRFSSS